MMLSVDPDVRNPGCALWRDGGLRLEAAGLARSLLKEGSGLAECHAAAHAVEAWVIERLAGQSILRVSHLVVEWPQIYQRGAGKSKADPNGMLPLAAICGALAEIFNTARMTTCTPHDWKGGVGKPKRVSEPYAIAQKVRDRLSPEEQMKIALPTAIGETYDVWDAIGVGLHAAGRFERRRAYATE